MPSKDLSQDELVVLYKEGAEKLEALLADLPKNGLDESLGPEEWTLRACSILLFIIITACCNAKKPKVTQKHCVCGDQTPQKSHF